MHKRMSPHGEDDYTVALDVIEDFCSKYDIKLKVFPKEKHGLLNSCDKVNQEIVNFLYLWYTYNRGVIWILLILLIKKD